MTALVAGGAGFIGSHLCEYFLSRGWDVICVDNLLTGRRENIAHLVCRRNFQFLQKDITRKFVVRRKLDVVFNLASCASPRDYLTYPLETLAAGAEGTRNLLELSRANRAIFIHASTSEVYGDPDVHPQSESYWGRVNPIGPRSVYDEAKRYAEALIMAYHRKYSQPVRIARIFNTYGPRMKVDDGRVIPNLIHQALTGAPLTIYGRGVQTRSFCYVTDIVEGLARMLSCPEPQPVNLGNPEEFTIIELARLIKKITGSRSRFIFRPLPEDDPMQRCPDITRARKLLGWKPVVKLENGLKRTIAWFRETGNGE